MEELCSRISAGCNVTDAGSDPRVPQMGGDGMVPLSWDLLPLRRGQIENIRSRDGSAGVLLHSVSIEAVLSWLKSGREHK
jgi:hypothetical protein